VQTKATMAVMAQFLASQGAVVFAPSVGGGWEGPQAPAENMEAILSEVPCAIAFAAEHAPEYGGDPGDINVYGYSGGARSAGVAI
jgi:acetyl esterase/lipase